MQLRQSNLASLPLERRILRRLYFCIKGARLLESFPNSFIFLDECSASLGGSVQVILREAF